MIPNDLIEKRYREIYGDLAYPTEENLSKTIQTAIRSAFWAGFRECEKEMNSPPKYN